MIQRAKNVQDEVTFLRERISFLKNIIMAVTKVVNIEIESKLRTLSKFLAPGDTHIQSHPIHVEHHRDGATYI